MLDSAVTFAMMNRDYCEPLEKLAGWGKLQAKMDDCDFNRYRFERFYAFAEKMEGLGFQFDFQTFANDYGWIIAESRVMDWAPGKPNDCILVRGYGVNEKEKRGASSITLSLTLNRALRETNNLGMACPRAFTTDKNGCIVYDMKDTGYPTTDKLIRLYQYLDWRIHPTLKTESGLPLMYYHGDGYTVNPHKAPSSPAIASDGERTITRQSACDDFRASRMGTDPAGLYADIRITQGTEAAFYRRHLLGH